MYKLTQNYMDKLTWYPWVWISPPSLYWLKAWSPFVDIWMTLKWKMALSLSKGLELGPILWLRVSAQFHDWTFTRHSGRRWKGKTSHWFKSWLGQVKERDCCLEPPHRVCLSCWEHWQALVTQLYGGKHVGNYMILELFPNSIYQ